MLPHRLNGRSIYQLCVFSCAPCRRFLHLPSGRQHRSHASHTFR
ncbi:MAG TPA: hypothetical protein DDX70_07835 [Bacteroides sp.]|nr:hypothetical protein [Bacteroides sp.]